ncbi:MAG: hypothetical protein DSZ25_01080 [Thermovibrio sp.]|nr:MAG: hypothetical protein DSZ25_01080 [Thermovibrio sp.]
MVEYDGEPVMKLSPGKKMYPGRKQVFRKNGEDVVSLFEENIDGEPLLRKVFEDGRLTSKFPSLSESREFFLKRFEELPKEIRNIYERVEYPVLISSKLEALYSEIERRILEKTENNND